MEIYLGQPYVGANPASTSNTCTKMGSGLLDEKIYKDISKHQHKKNLKQTQRSVRILKGKRIKAEKSRDSILLKKITGKMIECVKENVSVFDICMTGGSEGFIEKIKEMDALGIKQLRILYAPEQCELETNFNDLILNGVKKTIKNSSSSDEINEDLLFDLELLNTTLSSMKIIDIYINFIKTHRKEFDEVFGRTDEYLKIFERVFTEPARRILKNTKRYADIKMEIY